MMINKRLIGTVSESKKYVAGNVAFQWCSLAAAQFRAGKVTLAGCLLIILLAADFFIPMRQLGSFFHIAMNGMAASDKIFRLLDLPEPAQGAQAVPADCSIVCRGLRFSYEPEREVLHGVDLDFPMGGFTAIVGESGCGKSTVASLLMGKPAASDTELWAALEQVNLADFLRGEKGLDTPLTERGSNLSGGQCQRLALARALLHDSPVYIFDEATSNIDVESENDIMAQIHALAKSKTVILISHRLANVADADNIYVMEHGVVTEHGGSGYGRRQYGDPVL